MYYQLNQPSQILFKVARLTQAEYKPQKCYGDEKPFNTNVELRDDELHLQMLQISKILNAHMESLQWVDQNAGEFIHLTQADDVSTLN